ncbi:hypothetical protein [Mucilaginibacter sp. CSA2-8R]|uniref:hypothetical protein n=1 Tax=Mucilaginibacter sp. CSA2-8R TaxID=3141542 RepID=UPI00315C5F52
MKLNLRQTKTLIYLLAATVLGALATYFSDDLSAMAALSPPVFFSLGLLLSNRPYLQSGAAYVYLPFAFFLLYFLGYGTALATASLLTPNTLYQNMAAVLATLTIAWLITWGTLNQLIVSYLQPLLVVVLGVAGSLLLDWLKWWLLDSKLPILNPAGENLILNIVIMQFSLIIIILSMMGKGEEAYADRS